MQGFIANKLATDIQIIDLSENLLGALESFHVSVHVGGRLFRETIILVGWYFSRDEPN